MTDIIKFTSHPELVYYTCSHPGDRSGEYVRAEEVDWFALNLLLRCQVHQGDGWFYINDPEARRCAAYLKKRDMVEVDEEKWLFRWLNLEAGEEKENS